MMQQKERGAIIVGGGPAGAICAAYLAKEGVDVLLLDKDRFPRQKPCGDLVGEGITSHIEKLEIIHELDEISTFIKRIKIITGSGREAIMPFECYSLARADLDMLLLDTAAKWGAEVWQGCQVTDVIEEEGFARGVKIRYRGCETEVRSKLVIGADGATSQVAKSLGVMKEKSSGRGYGQRAYFKGVKLSKVLAPGQYDAYGVFCFDELVKPCYFWAVPVGRTGVEEGYCNVGMMVYDRETFRGMSLEESFNQWVKRNPIIAEMFEDAKQIEPWLGGDITDASQRMEHFGNGFILIGDAAALMMPLKKDGLSKAADSAAAAAKAAVLALRKKNCSREFFEEVIKEEPQEDKLKEDILMIQSLYDSKLMDRIIMNLLNNG
ncbi:MAG: geranylgeranyl reductase family protein [Clostridiales bacterium]|nr:geranylgeranyl reductase family protein [Clostridiales bacterium]